MRRSALILVTLVVLVTLVWTEGRHLFTGGGSSTEPTTGPASRELSSRTKTSMPPMRDDRRPGDVYEVELAEPAATRFAAGTRSEADKTYAGILDALGHRTARYDANLGHAARELAYQHSIMEGLVPQQVVDFLLRSAGAVDRQVVQAFTSTTGSGLEAVRKRLRSMLASVRDGKPVRVGVGEAYAPGVRPMHFIAVLLSHREIRVAPTPRRVALGATWKLKGTLPLGFRDPSALVLRPGGGLETLKLTHRHRRFSLTVDAGEQPGVMHVSVSASGPFGPKPLVQLPVVVGERLPAALSVQLPPDERGLASFRDAEALAFDLLNADRRHFGLPELVRDTKLDKIARDHSVDMRDDRFFGHFSPTSGSPGDRMAAASYRAATHAENVARGGSIHGAERGLLKSLGHRRNILNANFTHVGIGVAGQRVDGRVDWHLTQLFSKPVEVIDAREAETRIVKRLNEARRDAGAKPMAADLRLGKVVRRAARRVAAGATKGVPQAVLDRAKSRRLIRGAAYVSVQAVVDLKNVSIPQSFLDRRYRRVGVGVVQLKDHPQGLIGVVILVAGDS